MRLDLRTLGRAVSLLVVAAVLVLAVSACGDDATGPPDPASLAGTWTGTTSQGRTLSFVISNSQVTSLTVGFFVVGSFCTTDGEVTVGGAVPIEQTENFSTDITFTDPSIHIQGSFKSSSSAEGTVTFSSGQCGGTSSATWTASKGSGGGGDGPSQSQSLTGTWQGTYSTSLVSTTGATATLIQNGSSLSGSFVGSNGYSATVSGSVSGSNVQFTLTSTVPGCSGSFIGTANLSGATLTASFQGSDCLGTHTNGTATLTKQ